MKRGITGVHALIALDKPEGPSSHDIVNRLRKATGEGRIGHAGTLDPAASGVLVCCIGQATRLSQELTGASKTYLAGIAFGRETSTDDAEGQTTYSSTPAPELSDTAYATAVLTKLVGEIEQVPPNYSAVSQGGVRAYAAARRGSPLKLESRVVRIFSAELLDITRKESEVLWTCVLRVSKGCYIRSIARDLGRDVGCGAYLRHLRRTASGSVGLADCLHLEDLDSFGIEYVKEHALDPVSILGIEACQLSAQEARAAAHGTYIAPAHALAVLCEHQRVALVRDNRMLGIWHRSHDHLESDINIPAGIIGVRS